MSRRKSVVREDVTAAFSFYSRGLPVSWRMVNALSHETSPYLLQHANNPVAWQPWSEQAFEQARAEEKLVFLSIGYSTCHWCHVMEHECFEDPEMARVMNRHFINIKVDREERPDLDAAYMAYVQASTGHGGWPMSVWLTPSGEPVFGGTYFPPDDRAGRPGFRRVCEEIGRLWRDERAQLASDATRVMTHLRQSPRAADFSLTAPQPDPAELDRFLGQAEALNDPEWGGFGGAPKFPRPALVRTLMQLSDRWGAATAAGASAWKLAAHTLRAMAHGGIHDHLGGGFHRYAVDRFWHIPHYEKMLYDQAQLARIYLDAWQVSGELLWRETANGIFNYLLGWMCDPGGGFHAAEDADSLPVACSAAKREGAFWTWSAEEIAARLTPRDAEIFNAAYGVEPEGNARPESDPHGELTGQNTLYLAMDDDALVARFGCPIAEIHGRLAIARQLLAEARAQRPRPDRDDKIITAWNGLALGALARGAWVLNRPDLADAASNLARFLRANLWDGKQLLRSWRGGRPGKIPGFPADYVFLIHGLIELHAVDASGGWLDWAVELQNHLDTHAWDSSLAGYVMRPGVGGQTLQIIREDYDGAEPSPNHMAIENLLKLESLLDRPVRHRRIEALLCEGARGMQANIFGVPLAAAAMDLHDRGVMKIQLPADSDPWESLRRHYLPRAVFTRGSGSDLTVCDRSGCRPWQA